MLGRFKKKHSKSGRTNNEKYIFLLLSNIDNIFQGLLNRALTLLKIKLLTKLFR